MLSRKEHSGKYNFLPDQWQQELQKILLTTYKNQCVNYKKSFSVYGLIYPTELIIITSFLDQNDQNSLPVTLFLSVDITDNNADKTLLNGLVDFIGIFFDSYFKTTNWDEYNSTWTEETYKKIKLFHKITRENVELTLKADQILEQDLTK